jgi:hypothetical protein|tara:strand:- start:85 stop:936 length:852 start_codon:yes stop_codon:yes gene_type:complete
MNKITKLINKKVDREDYKKFVNNVHQKMEEENNNTLPTFKECKSAIKRLYRFEMKKSLPKHYTFKETSGNRHTWCQAYEWRINNQSNWRDIIHSACHWIEYRKYGSEAKIHNLNSFRMEKRFVEYAYKHKWHMGSLIRQTKPKVEVNKDVLMIERLTNNILRKELKLKTTIKRTETLLKKDRKKLRYYQKKVANGIVNKPRAKGYKVESYKQKAERLIELNPNIELDPYHELYDGSAFFPCKIHSVNDDLIDPHTGEEWCSEQHEHYSWKPLYEDILRYSENK